MKILKSKLTWLIAISMFFTPLVYGQKTTVGILPFTYVTGTADLQTVHAIQENVSNAFVKTKRFVIVDRSKMEALSSEKELQKSEEFMDGNVVAQGVNLGADYFVSGHVLQGLAESIVFSDGSTEYKAKLEISLKIIDVATGEVLTSETISPKAGSMFASMAGAGPKTPEAAITKALKDIEDDVDEFVANNFPLTGSIVEMDSNAEMLIALGSNYGIKKKDKFKVVEISEMMVDGKKLVRKKLVGEIYVITVEDENFSKCKVKKGGDAILAKFSAGSKIKCISID